MKFDYKKILIIGCGGCGKSTLAKQMGKLFDIPVVHLDKLYWLPNWVERNFDEFDALVTKELKKDNWIIDGNYSRTLETRLQYADLCIFLDYPTELCLQSVYERVKIYQDTTRPDMKDGCVEQVDDEFIEWINNYNKNIRPVMFDLLEKSNVTYLIFKSREETQNWLDAISN